MIIREPQHYSGILGLKRPIQQPIFGMFGSTLSLGRTFVLLLLDFELHAIGEKAQSNRSDAIGNLLRIRRDDYPSATSAPPSRFLQTASNC